MSDLLSAFIEMTSVNAPSYDERFVGDILLKRLKALGVHAVEDGAGAKIGGSCGNIHAFIEGVGEPIMFSAHLDTVEPSLGKKPVIEEDEDGTIIRANGRAVLGADDIAGVAIILDALATVLESGKPHRPIDLLFTVAEEVYGKGAEAFDYSLIRAKEAYTLDLSGDIGTCALKAPTIFSFTVKIAGKAAHAGFSPQRGINALAAAAKAIGRLPQGELREGLTRNFGVIEGGKQSNIVCDFIRVKGEIRALVDDDATTLWNETLAAFDEETANIGATFTHSSRREIIAYKTPDSADCVSRYKAACELAGAVFNPISTMGGSDHNEFALHGITGIVIACSMHNVHTTSEYAVLREMEQCRDIVAALML